jgi:glycosyltransferase involved in cell wall biosynthesis
MSGSAADGRLNILFAHEFPDVFGGAETNIRITAEELKKRGHKLGLLYTQNGKNAESTAQTHFSESFCLPKIGAATRAADSLNAFKPDVLYVHKLKDLDLFEALVAQPLPVVRMVHDHEMYCLRQYKYNPLTRAICTRSASGFCVFPCLAPLARNRNGAFPLKWASYRARQREIRLSKQCDGVIAYSEFSKSELVRNGFDPEKIHIHVPIRCWGEDGPISSFGERNLILFAGQIIRGKGVDLLLRALAKLTGPFECILLGEGSHRAYCEKLCAALGLDGRVKFAGYVPHDQMREYYLEATVFAMPSVWPEPFGMAGPEAMRYGLPVVAFEAGAIGEWLKDGQNGFIAPWMDVNAFAAGLQLLLTDKGLARQMGRSGLAHVNNSYEAASQVDRLERLFRFFALSNEGQIGAKRRSSPTARMGKSAQLLNVNERQCAVDLAPLV